MKKLISTQQTPANITAVIDLLASMPPQLAQLSAGLSDEQLQSPLGDGERSFTEVLAHLINCEARTAEAIYLALLIEQPLVPAVHPERDWGKLLHYEAFAFAELLAYFTFRRAALLRVLRRLTDAQWSRSIREAGKQRQESVYWQARTLALHEWEHVEELRGKARFS